MYGKRSRKTHAKYILQNMNAVFKAKATHDKENLVKKQMAPQMNYHHPVSVNI